MTPAIPVVDIGAHIVAQLTDAPSGIQRMFELAEATGKRYGGTVDTNRTRIRRAIEQCTDLQLVELTCRRSDWDVMLSDGENFMRAWIARDTDDNNRYVWRFVHERDQVGTGYGSGRHTWITTRATMAAFVAARRQAERDEQETRRKERDEATTAKWAQASERDPEYVALLRLVGQTVPGIEVRVVPTPWGDGGLFTGIEVPPESTEAFKILLRRIFPDAAVAEDTHTADGAQ